MPVQQPEYEEIDLKELIQVLWNGKWIILSFVLLAMTGAWVVGHLMLEPTYEATATLLIMPPSYQTSIEPEPLALDTYRDLALTPSSAETVVRKLGMVGDEGEPVSPESILRNSSISFTTTEVPRGEKRQSGVLRLKVTWSDPNEAQQIANALAELLMESAASIRKSESDEVARVIVRQFESTHRALEEAENRLLAFEKGAQIPLVRQRVEAKRAQLGEHRKYVFDLETQLEVKAHQLRSIQRQLEGLESAGQWVGVRTRGDKVASNNETLERVEVLRARKRLVEAEQALDMFENTAGLSLLRQELAAAQRKVDEYWGQLAKLRSIEPELTDETATLRSTLESQDDKITLSQSMTEDALWNVLISDSRLVESLGNVRLHSELPNPNYEYVEKRLIDAQTKLSLLPTQTEVYETLLEDSRSSVAELESTLRDLERQHQALTEELQVARKLYDSHLTQYSSLKEEHASLLLETQRLRLELDGARQTLIGYEKEAAEEEERLLDAQVEQQRLTREVDAIKQTYILLAQQAETARISELQATGDVRFISPAAVPAVPSGPNHKLNVAIAGLVAAMIGVGTVLLVNMLREVPVDSRELRA